MNEQYFSVVIKINHAGGYKTEIPTRFNRKEWSKADAIAHVKENSITFKSLDHDNVEVYVDENPSNLTNETHTWPDA